MRISAFLSKYRESLVGKQTEGLDTVWTISVTPCFPIKSCFSSYLVYAFFTQTMISVGYQCTMYYISQMLTIKNKGKASFLYDSKV